MATCCIKQPSLQAQQACLMSNPVEFGICFDPKEPVSDTWWRVQYCTDILLCVQSESVSSSWGETHNLLFFYMENTTHAFIFWRIIFFYIEIKANDNLWQLTVTFGVL